MCVCVCVCVCVWRGLWREGGNPTLELSKDKRKLSLVLKEFTVLLIPRTALGSWLLFQRPWIPRGRFRASFIPCSRSSSGGMPSEFAGSKGIPVPHGLFGSWDAVLGAHIDNPWWGLWSLQVWDTGSSCPHAPLWGQSLLFAYVVLLVGCQDCS